MQQGQPGEPAYHALPKDARVTSMGTNLASGEQALLSIGLPITGRSKSQLFSMSQRQLFKDWHFDPDSKVTRPLTLAC